MKVSFNGLRKNLCGTFNESSEIMEKYTDGINHHDYHDDCLMDEFKEKFNELGSIIEVLLCVYEPDIDGDFDDLSEDWGINSLDEKDGY
jgi:hypothetical protein